MDPRSVGAPTTAAWRPPDPQIESQDALPNVAEIVAAADGVMVARGDLGAQVPFENVPSIQVRAGMAAGLSRRRAFAPRVWRPAPWLGALHRGSGERAAAL